MKPHLLLNSDSLEVVPVTFHWQESSWPHVEARRVGYGVVNWTAVSQQPCHILEKGGTNRWWMAGQQFLPQDPVIFRAILSFLYF